MNKEVVFMLYWFVKFTKIFNEDIDETIRK